MWFKNHKFLTASFLRKSCFCWTSSCCSGRRPVSRLILLSLLCAVVSLTPHSRACHKPHATRHSSAVTARVVKGGTFKTWFFWHLLVQTMPSFWRLVFLVFFFFIFPRNPRISAEILRFPSFFRLIRLISPKFFVFLSLLSPNRPIFAEISFFGFHWFKWWKW